MHPITLQCTFKITLWKMLAMMMIRRKEGNHFPSFILKSPLLIFSNVILKCKVLQYEITVEWSTRNSQFFEGTKTSHVLFAYSQSQIMPSRAKAYAKCKRAKKHHHK